MQLSRKVCLALLATTASSVIFAGQSRAGAMEENQSGLASFQAHDLQVAIWWFDKSIAHHLKGYAEPYINKGLCLQKLGHHDRAISCYDEAIILSPKIAVAYQNRGTAYLHLKRYAESLKDLNMAISLPRPSSLSLVTVYIDRGRAYAGLHRWKESFADFDYVMSMKSTSTTMEKLRLAAAQQKKLAQELMAQVGQAMSTTSPAAVHAPTATPHTTTSTSEATASSSSTPSTSSTSPSAPSSQNSK